MATVASGTQASTIGSEHTLATQTSSGVYLCYLNTANMVAGDVTIARIYVTALSSGTPKIIYEAVFAHAQPEPIKASVPVFSDYEIRYRVQQLEGSSRNYDWAIATIS